MSINAGRAIISLALDDSGFYQELQKVTDSFRQKIQSIGIAATATGATMTAALVGAVVKAQNDAVKLRAFEAVFRDATSEASKLATTISNDIGRSIQSIHSSIAVIAQMGLSFGMARGEAAELGADVTRMGADLETHFGLKAGDGLLKIQSALKGNLSALGEFGIALTESAVAAELQALGIHHGIEQATELQKAMAIGSLLSKQFAADGITGAAASDKFGVSLGNLSSAFSSLTNSIGTTLQPIYNFGKNIAAHFVDAMTGMVNSITRFAEECPIVVQVVGGIAGALTAVGATLAAATSSFAGWIASAAVGKAIQMAFVAVLQQIPIIGPIVTTVVGALSTAFKILLVGVAGVTATIGIAIAAVAAMGAGLYYLHQKTGALQPLMDGLSATGRYFASVWSEAVLPALQDVYRFMSGALSAGLSGLGSLASGTLSLIGKGILALEPIVRSVSEVMQTVFVAAIETITGTVVLLCESLSTAVKWFEKLMGMKPPEGGTPGGSPAPAAAASSGSSFWGRFFGSSGSSHAAERAIPAELQRMADNFKETLKTPQQKFEEFVQQLNKLAEAGTLDAGQVEALTRIAAKDRDTAVRLAYEQSEEGQKALHIAQFGESLRRETMTFEEQIREKIAQIGKGVAAGLDVGLAEKAIAMEMGKLNDHIKKQMDDARKVTLNTMQEKFQTRMSIYNAIGTESVQRESDQATESYIQSLKDGGFTKEAQSEEINYYGQIIARSRAMLDEVDRVRHTPGMITRSGQEAMFGLGGNSIDQKILEKEEEAVREAARGNELLERLLRAVEE
ncbi:hypothetical protein SH668x_001029 [Planctomicrobium sp. SH668]|uniref:hypothetical protein n=1 Tax=Planctomicrobium sp. SH668 TaxID=3448126 RepID=UPI003F5B09EE